MLLVFGANKFFHFFPLPEPPLEGRAYLTQLIASGFIFPLIGVIFIAAGAMLLIGRAVGLALVLIAPIVVNIFLYHLRFDPAPGAFVPGLILAVLMVAVAWRHQDSFSGLLR